MRRLSPERTQLPPKRQAKLEALQQEQADLEAQLSSEDDESREDEDDPRYKRLQEIDREIEKIEAARKETYSAETKAASGAVIALGWNGEAEYTRGLLRKEDAAALKKEHNQPHQDSGQPSSSSEDEEKPAYSAPLIESLTTHKTAAIAAELTHNSRVALAAVVHALALNEFRLDLHLYRAQTCLQISSNRPHLAEAKDSPAVASLEQQRTAWLARLPRQSSELWQWFLAQQQDTLLSLLSFCAAASLNAIQTKNDSGSRERLPHADALATALQIDMARWFTPTAENFFDRISKARIGEAMMEAGKPPDSTRLAMKKAQFAKLAELDLAGSGWLPLPIRIAQDFVEAVRSPAVDDSAYQDDSQEHDERQE
jgi:ParB family transcriptional regulator, chromosome partitioning protein